MKFDNQSQNADYTTQAKQSRPNKYQRETRTQVFIHFKQINKDLKRHSTDVALGAYDYVTYSNIKI